MRNRVLMLSLLTLGLLVPTGCRPGVMNGVKGFFQKILPKWSKGAPKAVPKVAPLVPPSKPLIHGIEAVLAKSKAVGEKLVALQPEISPQVYAHLLREWQQNDAELRSISRQLQDDTLSDERRNRLESNAKAAELRLLEIERLTEEYG